MRGRSNVVVMSVLSGILALFSACSSTTAPSSTSTPPVVQAPSAPADPVVVTPPTVSSAITLHYNEGLTAEMIVSDAIHAVMQVAATCVSWREGYVMPICGASDVSKGTRQSDGTWKYTVSGATVKGAWPQNQVNKTLYFGGIAMPTYTLFKPGFYDGAVPDISTEGLASPLGVQWLSLEVNWMSTPSLVAMFPMLADSPESIEHPLLRTEERPSRTVAVQIRIGL